MPGDSDRSFAVPGFAPPTRAPGLRQHLRAVRTVIDGWSPEVFAGGVQLPRFPGAPMTIGDPALAHEILAERPDEFPHGALFDRLFRPVWGRGIFIAEGEEWRWQRRAAAPPFRAAQAHALAPAIGRAVSDIAASWSPCVPIDLHAEMRRITLRVLFDALLSGDAAFPDQAEASRHVHRFLDGVGRFRLIDFMPMPERWRGSTSGRGRSHADWLRARIDATITARLGDPDPPSDLLALLMATQDPETGARMDHALLRDNLLGFIAAGTDTSSFALSWAWWLVANLPDVEQRLREEIQSVAGTAPIQPPDIPKLAYTRQVIRETQRLFPGAVSLVRTAAADCTIGGHRVKRGTMIQIATYAIHRLPALWEAPADFDPDRFAGDPRLSAGAYHPFGMGPRTCMGAAFAMTEMIVALAELVRGWRLAPDPARPVRLGIRLGGLVSRGGMWMTPSRRG